MVRTRSVFDAILEGSVPVRYLEQLTHDVATLCQLACRACEFGSVDLYASFRESLVEALPDNFGATNRIVFMITIAAVMMVCASQVGAKEKQVTC